MADAEGAFRRAAALVAGGSRLRTLAGLLTLDVVVTAILNLDTAAAFLTPLMLYVGGVESGPFLYGSVLMANAASLFLPGSNLTNLLVLGDSVSGATFLGHMLPEALVAVAVTGAGLLWWGRRGAALQPVHPGEFSPGVGVAAVVLAAVLVLVLGDPALPVLGVGLVAAALSNVDPATLRRAVGPLSLLGLLILATALGYVARQFDAPSLSTLETTGVAAGAAVLVNNLPAAALLSAHTPDHPTALLIGLNLGPNLAVTGSLSALIWWRSARALGAHPSLITYSRVGVPLALSAMALSLIVSG
ncbi:MAG: arsenical pump rane protein [Solirubrobacteraceae bacterium]|nr:arsenical pump rane protein [Solirubrobacteraceae bacterium]